MIACYIHDSKLPQIEVMRAVAESIGSPTFPSSQGLREDAHTHITMGFQCGSDDIIKRCIQEGRNYVFIDHSYFQRGYDKGNFRITYNGLMQSTFPKRPRDRLIKLGVKFSQWKTNGNIVVLIPPPEKLRYVLGLDGWTEKTLFELQKYTTRAIVVKHKFDARPLTDYLANAHALVAHNSIAAIEAVTYGVPVFVDKSSPAIDVGMDDLSRIERPIYPDREDWAASLCYGQWSLDEIKSGLALKTILGEGK